ncbi:MAG: hypothetical protein HYZ53_14545 [Planctomycetes bacterium]|nr:hypothetical protein [Planctomycetota bacterium]
MVTKKKDSPELFEVFKTSLRERMKAPAETRREPGTTSRTEPEPAPAAPAVAVAAPPAPEPPHEQPPPPAPSALADTVSGMGDQVFPLRYNTALLLLMLVLAAIFVSFALGVEVGKGRARVAGGTQSPPPAVAGPGTGGAPTAPSPGPRVEPPVRIAGTAPAGGQHPAARPPEPRAAETRPPAEPRTPNVPPAVQPRSNEFWTVRVLDYPNDREGDESAKNQITWLKGKGVTAFKTLLHLRGGDFIGVCTGRFDSDQNDDAEKLMEKVRGLGKVSFRNCNLVKIAEER